MKHAFTMLELVFVIVLVGIISALAIPRMDDSNLRQAADLVVSHIRYTQHLAMMDNKFVPSPDVSKYSTAFRKNTEAKYWYKGRWQIYFSKTNLNYIVFADSPTTGTTGEYNGDPNQSTNFFEVAKNPEDVNRYLIGKGQSAFTIGDEHITENINLGDTYGIQDIILSSSCSPSGSTRIAFDYLGRPIVGNLSSISASYQTNRMLQSTCEISLCQNSPCDDQNITIAIEPETGYTHILN